MEKIAIYGLLALSAAMNIAYLILGLWHASRHQVRKRIAEAEAREKEETR